MDNIFIAPNGKKYTCIVYAIDEFQLDSFMVNRIGSIILTLTN